MTTKFTQGIKGEALVKVMVGVLADDVGLDHEAGHHAARLARRTTARLIGRAPAVTRKQLINDG